MGLSPNDASGNVTVTFADAVVRVLGVELRGLCRLRQRAPDHQSTPVNFTKWDTQKAAGLRLAVRALLHVRICRTSQQGFQHDQLAGLVRLPCVSFDLLACDLLASPASCEGT